MKLEPDDIRDLLPVIREVVRAVLTELKWDAGNQNPRKGYPEREAAELMGVPFYVLRDARGRGEIKATKMGRKWVYSTEELNRFFAGGHDARGCQP